MPSAQQHALVRVLCEVASDFAFVPALVPVAAQRRHFVLSCAVVQLFSTIMYNLCDALDARQLFLNRAAWHQVSDVLTLTYILLVLVHLMQYEEAVAAALRYAAFFLAWIFKLRDQWDSRLFEGILVTAFVLLLFISVVQYPERLKRLESGHTARAFSSATLGVVFFILSQSLEDPLKLMMGGAHLFTGIALFSAWSAFPPPTSGQFARHGQNFNSFV